MSHSRCYFEVAYISQALPQILSLCKFFTCMRKGLHAPKYSEKFPGYQESFICIEDKMLPQRCLSKQTKVNGTDAFHSHNFNEGILFQSVPIFLWGRVRQTSHISLAEIHSIPKVFLPKQTRVHAPWVSVTSSWITRAHQVDGLETDETFLAWKDHSGMEFDYLRCVNQGMTFGPRAWPFCLRVENTLL